MLDPTVFVPAAVLRQPTLSPAQKRLWALLAGLGPTTSLELCRWLGCRRETLYRALAKLEQAGLLRRERRAGRLALAALGPGDGAGVAVPVELLFDVGGEALLVI